MTDKERLKMYLNGAFDLLLEHSVEGSAIDQGPARETILSFIDRPSLEEIVGSMYAYACVCMDRGKDIRQIEVPIIHHSVCTSLGISDNHD